MSTRDFFKNSVLEAFGQVDPAKIGLSLLVALAMGILIYCVYKRFFTGVVYSRSFAVTLVGMCVLTCMVTLAISTNVVISLGMVGALSIVRYRTAVKDPLDLLYLFWAITTVKQGDYKIPADEKSEVKGSDGKTYANPTTYTVRSSVRQRAVTSGWTVTALLLTLSTSSG